MLRLNHYLFLTKAVFVSFSCPLNTKLQGQFEFQKQPSQQLWPMKTLIFAPSAFPALSEKEDSITLNPHLSSRPTFPHVLTCWLCVSNQAKNGEMSMLNEKIGVLLHAQGSSLPKAECGHCFATQRDQRQWLFMWTPTLHMYQIQELTTWHTCTEVTTSHCQPAQRLRKEKKSPQVYSDFHGKHKLLKNILHALWDSETGIGLGNVNPGVIGPSASCAVEIDCFLF